MGIHIDYGVSKNCKNPDSYGMICVKCNKCGRFTIKCFLCKKLEVRMGKPRKNWGQVEFYDGKAIVCPICRKYFIKAQLREDYSREVIPCHKADFKTRKMKV